VLFNQYGLKEIWEADSGSAVGLAHLRRRQDPCNFNTKKDQLASPISKGCGSTPSRPPAAS
jgi:hypothetical protein